MSARCPTCQAADVAEAAALPPGCFVCKACGAVWRSAAKAPDWCSECTNLHRPAGSPCPVHGRDPRCVRLGEGQHVPFCGCISPAAAPAPVLLLVRALATCAHPTLVHGDGRWCVDCGVLFDGGADVPHLLEKLRKLDQQLRAVALTEEAAAEGALRLRAVRGDVPETSELDRGLARIFALTGELTEAIAKFDGLLESEIDRVTLGAASRYVRAVRVLIVLLQTQQTEDR